MQEAFSAGRGETKDGDVEHLGEHDGDVEHVGGAEMDGGQQSVLGQPQLLAK